MQVHAALDQYRGNVQAELEYARQKIDAGADGLFTQPFFDIRLMDIYAEQIEQVPIFWGASPVLSDSSRSYWETRNRAYFPKDFAPTMEWNADFAKKLIEHAQAAGGHVYLMPIRVKISAYLGAIFGTAQ